MVCWTRFHAFGSTPVTKQRLTSDTHPAVQSVVDKVLHTNYRPSLRTISGKQDRREVRGERHHRHRQGQVQPMWNS